MTVVNLPRKSRSVYNKRKKCMKKTNSFQERVYEQIFLLKHRSVLDSWTSIAGCGGFLRRKTFVSRWERFSSTKLCKAILGDDGSRSRASSLRQHISHTADRYTCSTRSFALWKRNGSVCSGAGDPILNELKYIETNSEPTVWAAVLNWYTYERDCLLSNKKLCGRDVDISRIANG